MTFPAARTVLALALAFLTAPVIAQPQDLSAVADRWRVQGIDLEGERYAGEATITRDGEVRLTLDHQDPALAGLWKGRLEARSDGTFQGRLSKGTSVGMTGRLGGASGGAIELTTTLSLSERGDVLGGEVFLNTGSDPRPLGRQELRRGDGLDLDGDDLVVVDDSELQGLKGSEPGADRRLDLAFGVRRKLHLAVSYSNPRVLRADELTELQRQSLADDVASYWVKTEAQGSPRVALKASVPIGPVKATVGFEAGAKLRYSVTEHQSLPPGVTDPAAALGATTRWAFDLPLTAERALAKSSGAELVLEGEGSLAIRGSLSVGVSGTLSVEGKEVVRTGASVRAGGFYEVRGYLRMELQRLAGDQVRLRVTQGKQQRHGVFAEAFVGAYVPKPATAAAAKTFTPGVAYLDERVRRTVSGGALKVEKELLRIGLKRSREESTLEQLDLSYAFDLALPAAREAYEAAVRGDLTRASAAAEVEDSGVRQVRRVWKAEEQVHDTRGLQVSAVRGEESRTVTNTDLLIDSEDGRSSAYSIYDYEHQWSFGPLGREKSISARVVRMREGSDLPTTVRDRSFTYRYIHNDPISTRAEIDLFLAGAVRFGLPGAAEKARRLQANRPNTNASSFARGLYGSTRRSVELDISHEGIRAILQAGSERLLQAYASAIERLSGVAPIWADARLRKMLERLPKHRLRNWYGSEASLRDSKERLTAARQFVKSMHLMATATTDEDRALHLTRVADAAGFGLEVAAALVELAPPGTVRIRAAIEGSSVHFESELKGLDASTLTVPQD